MAKGTAAFIGVGSNIEAYLNCTEAEVRLASDARLDILAVSSLYRTSPVSPIAQDDYLNYVIKAYWVGTAYELLALLNLIETTMGRSRNIPLGPRTIDLDILIYGDQVLDTSDLVIPHPRLHERKFTLMPCCEIDPDLVHPVMKKPLCQFLDNLGEEQKIEVYCGPGWEKADRQ
jgi:2-amino-4-hydroxy-6-hydroxymethyldihydropteridine diphosphokinase